MAAVQPQHRPQHAAGARLHAHVGVLQRAGSRWAGLGEGMGWKGLGAGGCSYTRIRAADWCAVSVVF